MKLLLLADLHLGARLTAWGRHAEARRDDLLRAWSQAVDAVIDGPGADAVLIAGDLFDSPDPAPEVLDAVLAGLTRWHEAGVPTVLLPGNYDGLFVPRSVYDHAEFPDSVTVIRSAIPEVHTLEVAGQTLELHSRINFPGTAPGWWAASETDPAQTVRVGLWHARLPGAEAPGGWLPPELTADALQGCGLHLAVAGGAHEFSQTLLGSVPVVSPGAPVGLRPGEWGEREFTVAAVENGAVSLERVPVDAPPVIAVHVDLAKERIADEAALLEHLAARYSDASLVTLRLSGPVGPGWSQDRVREGLAELSFAVDLIDESVLQLDHPEILRLRDESTVCGLFTRTLADQLAGVGDEGPEKHIFSRSLAEGLKAYASLRSGHVD